MTPPSEVFPAHRQKPDQGHRERKLNLLHPWFFAWLMQPASVEASTYPVVASALVAGFPITSLLAGTPEAMIWKSAVLGQVEDEAVSRPEQVVYSDAPSV